jgi:lysophospholipase L1-like esterase
MEICARVDDYVTYGAPFWKPYNVEQIYDFDALGRRGKPNAQFRKWKLNSLGYRGPELRTGSIRIVVFGASETFGLYENPDHEFPRLLDNFLNSKAGRDRFDVVNLAYAGMPLMAMTPRVPEVVARLRPRFALIYPTPANYIWLPWLKPEMTPFAQPKFDFRLKDQLRTMVKQAVPNSLLNWARNQEINKAAQEYGTVMDRIPEQNVQRFTRDLKELTSALRSRGVQPVLLTHAHRFHNPPTDEDREMLTAWRKFYPMLAESGFLDMEKRINDAIAAVAASEAYPLIDTATRIPPGSRNFADFTHFTDEGSAIMANVLADGLYPVLDKCCESLPQIASHPQ